MSNGTYFTPIPETLTKRELFAAMAMQGMLSDPIVGGELVAPSAVGYADALLAELERTQ